MNDENHCIVGCRVVGRNRECLAAAFGDDPQAEVVTWSLDDPASVTAVLQGVETAIYLIGAPYDQNQLHPILTKQVLDGAIAAQVKRIVLLGTVYPYGIPTTPTVSESHARELVEMNYLQTTPVLLDDSALVGLLGTVPCKKIE